MPPFNPTVTPSSWSTQGEAIVSAGGRHLYVWGGIPGERAEVRVVHRGRNQDRALFLSAVAGPSAHRRRPPCGRYQRCGACPLMHLDPPGQERFGLAVVREALEAEGLVELAPRSIVASPDGEVDYRHVVKLSAGRSDIGHVRLGAHARATSDIVPIPDCVVATPVLREAMKIVSHHIIDMDVWPYDPETGRGLLRYVLMRQSRRSGAVLVTLVAARRVRVLSELAQRILEALSAATGVVLHLNDQPGNAIFAPPDEGDDTGFQLLGGRPFIEDELADVRLAIGPDDFFHANPSVADRIARDVLAATADLSERPVVDLFCGVGGLSVPLARQHGWALGVELQPSAVERARENARVNRVSAEFFAGRTADLLPDVVRRTEGTAPVVVVDPARRGLEPAEMEGLVALNPARVAYLSCNANSMARDLATLTATGWNVDSLRVYDMFPQTPYVELLAMLSPHRPVEALRAGPKRRIVR